MDRFSDFDQLVAEFMREWGFTATYLRTLSSVPNDATGGVDVSTQEIQVSAIRSELFRPLNGSGTKPNTAIQEGDLILYVQPTEKADEFAEALVIDPSADKVIVNGETWAVVTCKAHAPDPSDVILYELYIRK
jgi:hypothetical protein